MPLLSSLLLSLAQATLAPNQKERAALERDNILSSNAKRLFFERRFFVVDLLKMIENGRGSEPIY